jgi:FMN phosphatase YigB (HAD superfamily)
VLRGVRLVCVDWGGTLMSEDGPADLPMALWPEVRALPGAHAFLAGLHGRVPLAVATNATVSSRAHVERALDRAGLARFVGAVHAFTELGVRKDRPAFWDAVARRSGCAVEEIAMVGDSLEQDARAPRRFGVQAVWLDPEGRGPTPDGVPRVASLAAFADAVRAAL